MRRMTTWPSGEKLWAEGQADIETAMLYSMVEAACQGAGELPQPRLPAGSDGLERGKEGRCSKWKLQAHGGEEQQ